MPKRLLLALILAFAPLTATADDTDPTMNPLTAPDTTQAAPPAPTTAANGLGPQTSANSAGGSNADGSSLQPAGLSPLQSTTNDAVGLTAPTTSALQAPASSDYTLRVLAGEADGAPHRVAESSASPWGWAAFSLIIGALVAGVATVLRDRRRFRDPKHHASRSH